MKCKILKLRLIKLYNTFYPENSVCTSPCMSTLCPKLPLLAAIIRQQHVHKIIQNKCNNHNDAILYTNIVMILEFSVLFLFMFLYIYFLLYMDFQSAEKVTFPHTCFTTHMLQNKENLLLMQWHLKIFCTDRNVSFNNSKQYILLP